jgi:hypothetical protein
MQFHIEEIVCILRTQVTMEIEGEEGNVNVVNSKDPLLKFVADNDCISRADLTQQKGKHCYLNYKSYY